MAKKKREKRKKSNNILGTFVEKFLEAERKKNEGAKEFSNQSELLKLPSRSSLNVECRKLASFQDQSCDGSKPARLVTITLGPARFQFPDADTANFAQERVKLSSQLHQPLLLLRFSFSVSSRY